MDLVGSNPELAPKVLLVAFETNSDFPTAPPSLTPLWPHWHLPSLLNVRNFLLLRALLYLPSVWDVATSLTASSSLSSLLFNEAYVDYPHSTFQPLHLSMSTLDPHLWLDFLLISIVLIILTHLITLLNN